MARSTVVAADDAKARATDDLTKALDALAVAEEDGRRLKADIARLAVERTLLLLDLVASKDKVFSLYS